MQQIINNPYRLFGLPVGASASLQNRHITRLPHFIEVGNDIPEEFSINAFVSLGNINRTIENLNEAASKLNLFNDKMNAALFWFWNGSPISDEAAFDALKEGDVDAAYQIWDNLITETNEHGKRFWKPVSEKNYSAFHNCFVINMLKTNGNLHNAVVANIYFLESDLIVKFIKVVGDETDKPSKKELQLLFLNQLFLEKKDKLTQNEIIEIITQQEFSAKDDFLKGFVQKPFEQIEKKIEESKTKRKANKANGVSIGKTLLEQTAENLKQLKSILGASSVKYSSIADKVANEILQCSIDFFNHYQEIESDIDYFESAWKLTKSTEGIAISKLTKDRILDSLNSLEEMKAKEILQAIQLLQSIKNAYEENKKNIKQQVKELEETDIEIRLGRKSINHSAVEDNIKNSINWQKVNELLATSLSDNNLRKIKESENIKNKIEFLELANWLKENSLKSSTISTIINKYKQIPPKLPFKILSSDLTNSDNKPFYSKFIRYVGLNLNVQVTEEKSVTLFIKYINPNGNINRNSETSPRGYTRSQTQNLNINTKSINLKGWGNSDKCTFGIGKHLIEVYVDEYLIHSNSFSVDLAPSEKLQIELKKAEDKLIEIKNTQYFKSELQTLNSQMDKIKQWQFLRSQSDREEQIKEQQQKINSILKRADNEKSTQSVKQLTLINEIKSKIQYAEY